MERRFLLKDERLYPSLAEIDGKSKTHGATTNDRHPGLHDTCAVSRQLALLQLPPYSSRAGFE